MAPCLNQVPICVTRTLHLTLAIPVFDMILTDMGMKSLSDSLRCNLDTSLSQLIIFSQRHGIFKYAVKCQLFLSRIPKLLIFH